MGEQRNNGPADSCRVLGSLLRRVRAALGRSQRPADLPGTSASRLPEAAAASGPCPGAGEPREEERPATAGEVASSTPSGAPPGDAPVSAFVPTQDPSLTPSEPVPLAGSEPLELDPVVPPGPVYVPPPDVPSWPVSAWPAEVVPARPSVVPSAPASETPWRSISASPSEDRLPNDVEEPPERPWEAADPGSEAGSPSRVHQAIAIEQPPDPALHGDSDGDRSLLTDPPSGEQNVLFAPLAPAGWLDSDENASPDDVEPGSTGSPPPEMHDHIAAGMLASRAEGGVGSWAPAPGEGVDVAAPTPMDGEAQEAPPGPPTYEDGQSVFGSADGTDAELFDHAGSGQVEHQGLPDAIAATELDPRADRSEPIQAVSNTGAPTTGLSWTEAVATRYRACDTADHEVVRATVRSLDEQAAELRPHILRQARPEPEASVWTAGEIGSEPDVSAVVEAAPEINPPMAEAGPKAGLPPRWYREALAGAREEESASGSGTASTGATVAPGAPATPVRAETGERPDPRPFGTAKGAPEGSVPAGRERQRQEVAEPEPRRFEGVPPRVVRASPASPGMAASDSNDPAGPPSQLGSVDHFTSEDASGPEDMPTAPHRRAQRSSRQGNPGSPSSRAVPLEEVVRRAGASWATQGGALAPTGEPVADPEPDAVRRLASDPGPDVDPVWGWAVADRFPAQHGQIEAIHDPVLGSSPGSTADPALGADHGPGASTGPALDPGPGGDPELGADHGSAPDPGPASPQTDSDQGEQGEKSTPSGRLHGDSMEIDLIDSESPSRPSANDAPSVSMAPLVTRPDPDRQEEEAAHNPRVAADDVSRETMRGHEGVLDVGEEVRMEDEAATAVREAALRAAAEVRSDVDELPPDGPTSTLDSGHVSRETKGAAATGHPGAPVVVDNDAAAREARVTFRVGLAQDRRAQRVMAVANQKGGVGKSTTAVNLGAYLALAGARVLIVDLDPQGNASTGLGLDHRQIEHSLYDVLTGDLDAAAAVKTTPVHNLDVLPSTIDLAGAEVELVSAISRESRLRRALTPVRYLYDVIIIDCPPSLGLLTVNALAAADELLIPIQCEYYALEGLGQLLRNVDLVRANLNPQLRIGGIVLTMYDGRTRLAEQVVYEVRKHFTDIVYRTVVPRSVRLSEAPGYGVPIALYDPLSRGGIAYRDLTLEFAARAGLLVSTVEGAS